MSLAVRLAIADDDTNIRELLAQYVERYCEEYSSSLEIVSFASGTELLDALAKQTFDVIFLDIEMPGLSGMDTAREIRRTDSTVIIVFVTNLSQFALQGYEVQAMDYIVKPLSYFDFALKMTRIVKAVCGKNSIVTVLETTDGLRYVDVSDITFLEARNHYIYVHMQHGYSYKIRDSMTHQAHRFEKYGFLRVHKSFTINMKHIDALYTNEIICAGKNIPIGRLFKKHIQPAFLAYAERH
ncbi:LytR/AlgR family response regulator transcription factor [Alloscardovia omnicolens]|uniref:LytR/AlgR family response regulator transcription factor n=1 Tax=Alloscardovia omnicolens TaxID=419015 RepID=UPI003A5E9009